MQDKINSFNAAFVDLAAAYVRRLANKIAGNETYTAEPPTGPLRWGTSLADEMRVVNLLAATIGKMQAASDGELPQGSTADGKPHAADTPQGVETVKTNTVAKEYTGACVTIETKWGDEIKLVEREEVEELVKKLLEAAARVWPEAAPGKQEGEGENGTGKAHGRENRAATT